MNGVRLVGQYIALLWSHPIYPVVTVIFTLLCLLSVVAGHIGLLDIFSMVVFWRLSIQGEAHLGLPVSPMQKGVARVVLALLIFGLPRIVCVVLYDPRLFSITYDGAFVLFVLIAALADEIRRKVKVPIFSDSVIGPISAAPLPPMQALGELLAINRWNMIGLRLVGSLVVLAGGAAFFDVSPLSVLKDWTYAVPAINNIFTFRLYLLLSVLMLPVGLGDMGFLKLDNFRVLPVSSLDVLKALSKEVCLRTLLGASPLLIVAGLGVASGHQGIVIVFIQILIVLLGSVITTVGLLPFFKQKPSIRVAMVGVPLLVLYGFSIMGFLGLIPIAIESVLLLVGVLLAGMYVFRGLRLAMA